MWRAIRGRNPRVALYFYGEKMATAAEIQAELAAWKAAQAAVRDGAQSYAISGRTLTRASLTEINKKVAELEARLDRLTRKEAGESLNTAVPVFVISRQ